MSNRHNFNSSIPQEQLHNFDSIIKTGEVFSSVLSYIKNYNMTIDEFIASYPARARFLQENNITISDLDLAMYFVSTFMQDDTMSIDNSKIGIEICQTATFTQLNNIISRMSMEFPLGTPVFTQLNNIIARLTDQLILTGILFSQSEIVFDANPNVIQYYYLNYWDDDLLSVLDTMNLSDMDGIVV